MTRAVPVFLIVLLALPVGALATCTDLLCLDEAYGALGKRTVAFNLGGDLRDVGNAIARVPGEDAIFVVGQVAIAAGNTDFGVVRLDGAGTLDGSFSIDGRANYSFAIGGDPDAVDAANDAAVVPWGLGSDWRLAVVGQVQRATAGDIDFGVLLLRPNGDRETDANGGERVVFFDAGGDLADRATAVAVDSLGRIVIGGTVDVAPGESDWGFVRLHSNLAYDVTFGNNGKMILPVTGAAELRDLLVQPDDKIVAVGRRDFGAGQTIAFRLDTDGSPDASFGTSGVVVVDLTYSGHEDASAWGVAIDSQGRITTAGEAAPVGGGDAYLCGVQLLSTGLLDTGIWGSNGYTCVEGDPSYSSIRGRSVTHAPNGQIFMAGESVLAGSGNQNFFVLVFHSSGLVWDHADFGFDLGGSLDDRPRDQLLRPDGKLVVVGRAVGASGNLDFATVRLWTDIIFFDGFESVVPAVEWSARVGMP